MAKTIIAASPASSTPSSNGVEPLGGYAKAGPLRAKAPAPVIHLATYAAAKKAASDQVLVREQQAILRVLLQRVADGVVRGMVIVAQNADGEQPDLLICGEYSDDMDSAIAATARMQQQLCANANGG